MIKKTLSLDELTRMNQEDYIKTILDFDADNLDHQLENSLLIDLVNKYVSISNELEDKIKEVELLSITDPLTKIYNRLKFNRSVSDELERYKRYLEPFAILLLDIDYFKHVNDNYGHDIGDETLIHLTDIVGHILRKNDVFARWGGEEFIALVVNSDAENAKKLAERIRVKIATSDFNKVGHITVSIGVTSALKEDDIMSLVKRADDALYKAKNSGRNRVVFIED